jgi:hypothetical protein
VIALFLAIDPNERKRHMYIGGGLIVLVLVVLLVLALMRRSPV